MSQTHDNLPVTNTVSTENVDVDNFDPDKIDWDAISELVAAGELPSFEEIAPLPTEKKQYQFVVEQPWLGSDAQDSEASSDDSDGTNPKQDIYGVAQPWTVSGNQATETISDEDDNSEPEYDIFRTNFPKIGARIQVESGEAVVGLSKATQQAGQTRPVVLANARTNIAASGYIPTQPTVVPKTIATVSVAEQTTRGRKRRARKDDDLDISQDVLTKRPKTNQGPEASQNSLLKTRRARKTQMQPPTPRTPSGTTAPSSTPAVPTALPVPMGPPAPVAARTLAGLQFASYEEAQQAMANRPLLHDWQAPQNDHTVPGDHVTRNFYVRQLRDAFVDITKCIDKHECESFKDKWEGLGTPRSPYNVHQMVDVSRKLVDIAYNLHTIGPRSLPIYDPVKMEQISKSSGMTFAERIHAMCELMRLAKVRCEKLLKQEYLEVFVGMPKLLLAQTKMNKKMNAKRQETLVAGRKAQRGHINVHRDENKQKINLDAAVVNHVSQFIPQFQQQQPVGQGQAYAQEQLPRQGPAHAQHQLPRQGPIHPVQQPLGQGQAHPQRQALRRPLVHPQQQPPGQGPAYTQQQPLRQGPVHPQQQPPETDPTGISALDPSAHLVPPAYDPTAQFGELAPIARYNAEYDVQQRQDQDARDRQAPLPGEENMPLAINVAGVNWQPAQPVLPELVSGQKRRAATDQYGETPSEREAKRRR
jgi:hypothetical protein